MEAEVLQEAATGATCQPPPSHKRATPPTIHAKCVTTRPQTPSHVTYVFTVREFIEMALALVLDGE